MTQDHISRISGREPSLSGNDPSLQLTGLEPSISGEVALLTLLTSHQQGSTKWDQSACDQLGQMGKAALPSLLDLLKNGKNWRIRRASAVALGVINDPEAIPDLLMALRDRHPAVKNAAVESLRKSGKAAVPGLIALLNDADSFVRSRSIKLLGAIRDTRATPGLLEVFDRTSNYLDRCEIVDAVFALRDREALCSLVRTAFARQGDWREVVINKLKDTKRWQSIPDLVLFLFESLKSNDPIASGYATAVLSRISDKQAAPALARALQDPNELVRHHASIALSNIGDRRAVPGLIAMLSAEDFVTRFEAVIRLNALRDARTVPALEKALDDTYSSVQLHAAAGLWASGHEKARKIILEYLRHPDPSERGRTMIALAGTKDPDVIPFIEAGLHDKDTKLAAIRALGEFRNSKEACSLVELAINGETSEDVLRVAIDTFAKIGRPEAIPILRSFWHPHSGISWYAGDAVDRIRRTQSTSRT